MIYVTRRINFETNPANSLELKGSQRESRMP